MRRSLCFVAILIALEITNSSRAHEAGKGRDPAAGSEAASASGAETIGGEVLGLAVAENKSSDAKSSDDGGPLPRKVVFAVVGDTQDGEFGGHGNLLSRLVEAIDRHQPDYVLFPGDLVGDSGAKGWQAWTERTASLGDRRLMTPGNHDRGPDATFANWQRIFSWLPPSKPLNGKQGIDRVDYFVDFEGVRFVSISSDAPGQNYGDRVIDEAPPALDWLREVMHDVEHRNTDGESGNDIAHVFLFSHRPVTTQRNDGTGGTDGNWWRTMARDEAAAAALLPGHWHMYQPSRPDPHADTMEIISGTGGGGLEGQPHRNWHGFVIVTVEGPKVNADFYGDEDQGDQDSWNFELRDSFAVRHPGGLPVGELAKYEFTEGDGRRDSSTSKLSKLHELHFHGDTAVENAAEHGKVLRTDGTGGYADAASVGDNNLAALRDITIKIAARAAMLRPGDFENTLVAFGGAFAAKNESLAEQESANYAYRLSMNDAGILRMSWQHDDGHWESLAATADVPDPYAWHRYEVHRDAQAMIVNFYVDGRMLGRSVKCRTLPTGGGSGSLSVGASAGGEQGFNGWIDDVVLSTAPMKAQE